MEKYFKDIKPDVIVDVVELPKQKPSRLEDLREVGDIKVLRG